MDAIEIEGGLPLRGEVTVSGSKNATLPQIAAALLAPGPSTFHNVPDLADVRTMGRLIGHLGAKVVRGAEVGAHTLRVDASELPGRRPPTTWSAPCGPRCWSWGRSSRGSGGRGCRCPAGAPSARGPSIST